MRCILRDEDDVADAFATFSEAIWRGLPGFRWDASLEAWSYRVAHHAALAALRQQARRRRCQPLATTEWSRVAADTRTRSCARRERQHAVLEQLRAALSVADRELLTLRIGHHLAWEEIAAVLSREGHPVCANAFAKRFSRLKKRLEHMARDRGLLEG